MELLHSKHRRKALRTHKVVGFRIDLVLTKRLAIFISDSGNKFKTLKLIQKAFSVIQLFSY